eukprot:TRINITY_DN17839_c0_g2_i1.p1 TRINITY_DN17839_c0_g2~~TRINITY_DN17839_c0_g2_i1.p1  ORF type:complete len:553 (+),score=151.76 TRINITY_DN17839_c0_g2_i1:82-1740(+)
MNRVAQRVAAVKGRRYECDYLIVGGGTAGCVLANRLSKNGSKVTMLEAGGEDDWIWLKIPVGYLFAMMNERCDWRFTTTPQPGLLGKTIAYPRGKVLGGCSSINGTVYMRGQQADYDLWGQENEGWSWKDVMPYFRNNMDYYLGEDELHATGGEWSVSHPRIHWEVLDVFREAAENCGIPHLKHFNNSDQEGCGYFQVTHKDGVRCSASTAFLKPVLHRPNLKVIKHALVEKVLTDERGLATSVVYSDKAGTQHTIGGKHIILTAGAIGTPHLLQVSGLGPAAMLARHGVEVVKDIPGVGMNLHDHLQIRPVFRLKEGTDTLNQRSKSYLSMIKMGLDYALYRKGALSMAPSQFGAVAKSRQDIQTPDLEFHVQPLSCEKLELGHLDDFPGLTVSVCNLRPTSRGSVELAGPTVKTPPLIDPKYLDTENDKIVAADGIKLVRRIVGDKAFARLEPVEVKPGPDITSDQALVDSVSKMASSIFHPVSTCRMGPASDPSNVVDARLRMHAVPNLRIVDCSIMPTIPSGNTCSPVVMIAEKAADMILEDTKAGSA